MASAERIEDSAWSLPDLRDEAQQILGYFCFYPGKIATKDDGELIFS